MIPRKTRFQLVGFLLVALLGVSFVSFRYVGLDRLLFGGGYEVSADFTDSGGIFVNAEVDYRGVAVGRVTDLQLRPDGVRVVLTIDPDAPSIPSDTDAVVANRSAVGEQYVDLRPTADAKPFLAQGDVIPVSRTSIPTPVEQLLLHLDDLTNSIDTAQLRTLVDELGTAFDGAGDDLGRLIDNGDLLLQRADASLPATLALIRDGKTVLQTQIDSGPAVVNFAAQLRTFSDTLVSSDSDIRNLVVAAPRAADALQQLIDDAGPGLSSVIRYTDVVNGVVNSRLDGVQQLLVTYPQVVSGGFSVVRMDSDGQVRAHFGLVLNSQNPPACTTGYDGTANSSCTIQNGVDPSGDETGTSIRGEQNIGSSGGAGSTNGSTVSGAVGSVQGAVGDLLGGLLGGAVPFSTSAGG